MKKLMSLCAALLLLSSCKDNDGTEKFQTDRMVNVVSVEDKIVDMNTDLYLSAGVSMDIVGDFLVIIDLSASQGKAMHFFDKKNLRHVTSSGLIGKGPGEITRIGPAGVDKENKILWIPDFGKKVTWSFPMDSILSNPEFKPTTSFSLKDELFLAEKYTFVNDSIALGQAVHVLAAKSTFTNKVSRFNMNTGKGEEYGYVHPEAIDSRARFTNKVSVEHGIYVNTYSRCDLMTICDLNGNLICNVYGGNDWFNGNGKNAYFIGVDIYKNNIIASYNGDVEFIWDQFKRQTFNYPSKLLVFDLKGNHKKTIETGNTFTDFCVDEDNRRIIAYFDNRENPLGYFDLDFE